eukprot:5038786-Alexandrium_andersonii.AAC.1
MSPSPPVASPSNPFVVAPGPDEHLPIKRTVRQHLARHQMGGSGNMSSPGPIVSCPLLIPRNQTEVLPTFLKQTGVPDSPIPDVFVGPFTHRLDQTHHLPEDGAGSAK